MGIQRAVIFANGELTNPAALRTLIQPGDYLIAADGGLLHILRLGLIPHLLVGDLDSLPEDILSAVRRQGIPVEQYPTGKDETDLELALQHALRLGYRDILIAAAFGGRLDHTLGNLALLNHPDLLEHNVRLDDGIQEALIIRRTAQVSGQAGDLLSLIPWQGSVSGVTTQGLQYPLHGETLYDYHARGISNRMLAKTAFIQVNSGTLLCLHTRTALGTPTPESPYYPIPKKE